VEVKLKSNDIFLLIDTPFDGWIRRHKLGMIRYADMETEYGKSALWYAGNCTIMLMPKDAVNSTVELVEGKHPANVAATEIWGQLENSLKPFCKTEEVKAEKSHVEEMLKLLENAPKHDEPRKPPAGSNVYTWLDYYHAKKKAGYKMTFKILEEECNRVYAENTFKQLHGNYKRDRGLE